MRTTLTLPVFINRSSGTFLVRDRSSRITRRASSTQTCTYINMSFGHTRMHTLNSRTSQLWLVPWELDPINGDPHGLVLWVLQGETWSARP